MSNTRAVHTDALATLGTAPLPPEAARDAIHIAVEPVIAGESLRPGMHVRVENGVAWYVDAGKGLGIVDPFLEGSVRKGERFWFLMYPRMVTSLRHVWSHPAFKDEEVLTVPLMADPYVPPAIVEVRKIEAKAKSERWLRDWISNSDIGQWSYEDVLKVAHGGVAGNTDADGDGEYGSLSHQGEYIVSYGSDAYGEIPDEFWDHIEIVTGKKVAYRAGYFSCSC